MQHKRAAVLTHVVYTRLVCTACGARCEYCVALRVALPSFKVWCIYWCIERSRTLMLAIRPCGCLTADIKRAGCLVAAGTSYSYGDLLCRYVRVRNTSTNTCTIKTEIIQSRLYVWSTRTSIRLGRNFINKMRRSIGLGLGLG